MTHDALIASAESVLNPHIVDGRWLGDVASALVTEAGAVFSGVCIDTGSGNSAKLRDLLPHSEWPSQPDSRG